MRLELFVELFAEGKLATSCLELSGKLGALFKFHDGMSHVRTLGDRYGDGLSRVEKKMPAKLRKNSEIRSFR